MRHGGKPFSTARECPRYPALKNLTHGTSWKLKISARTARLFSLTVTVWGGKLPFTFSALLYSGIQCGPLGRTESSSADAPRPLRRQHPVSTFGGFRHLLIRTSRREVSSRPIRSGKSRGIKTRIAGGQFVLLYRTHRLCPPRGRPEGVDLDARCRPRVPPLRTQNPAHHTDRDSANARTDRAHSTTRCILAKAPRETKPHLRPEE